MTVSAVAVGQSQAGQVVVDVPAMLFSFSGAPMTDSCSPMARLEEA
jgi:hypothetical protein